MINTMRSFWDYLINRGISAGDRPSRKTAIRAGNVVIVTAVPTFIAFDIIFVLVQDYAMLAVNITFLCCSLIALVLAGYPRWNTFARVFFVIEAAAAICVMRLVTGSDSGVSYLYVMLICLTFIMFDNDERKYEVPLALYIAALFLLGHFAGDLIIKQNPSMYSNLGDYRLSSFIISSCLIFIIIQHLRTIYARAQHELERETGNLIHNERMVALGQMASSVAHEINNPLSVIRGLCEETLESLEEGKDIPMMKIYQSRVIAMAERINHIVRALGTYSRKNESDPFLSVSVQKIVNDAAVLFEDQYSSAKINFSADIPQAEMHIICREIQILQVLVNLLQNARDAVEGMDKAWIKLRVQVKDTSLIEFSVEDSGLTKDIRSPQRIFDPFYTTKEIGKGTGLGLSISQGIVRTHGGTIYLDSDSKNTQFVFTIPANKI